MVAVTRGTSDMYSVRCGASIAFPPFYSRAPRAPVSTELLGAKLDNLGVTLQFSRLEKSFDELFMFPSTARFNHAWTIESKRSQTLYEETKKNNNNRD